MSNCDKENTIRTCIFCGNALEDDEKYTCKRCAEFALLYLLLHNDHAAEVIGEEANNAIRTSTWWKEFCESENKRLIAELEAENRKLMMQIDNNMAKNNGYPFTPIPRYFGTEPPNAFMYGPYSKLERTE